jgi:hypothetical protein
MSELPKQDVVIDTLSTPQGSPSLNPPRTPDEDTIKNDQEFEHIINQFDEKNENDGNHALAKENLPNRRRPSADTLQQRRHSNRLEEIADVPFDFNRFLEQMKRRGAIPITKYFKR